MKEGEYLLAVNGREVRSNDDLDSYLEAAAEKATVLRVGPNPNEAGSREVTVVPIESEAALRHLAWVDANRRKVDQLSGGRVAYIYVPDTAFDGYARFNRYFFSQAGKEGAVIDERFNEGGLLADHVVDLLRQPLRSLVAAREGLDTTFPQGAVFGPKVMIINEMAGSGGDAMPYFFRQSGIGPLVGKRTWGGLVGTASSPALIDGGIVTAPSISACIFRMASGRLRTSAFHRISRSSWIRNCCAPVAIRNSKRRWRWSWMNSRRIHHPDRLDQRTRTTTNDP